ncbi:TPA_asm: restriction endonuclease subunit S [Listeria monocytogenes]|nr:restriction endonuclease subunit S [Listeria monocytogenes]HAB9813858.1 restriction endonuclease subunit S [Listeria monocytogenes]
MKYKLGHLIERIERGNSELEFGADDVRGISNTKKIQMTKADISKRSFKKFQIVKDREFVYNRRTTRMGEKIGLGFNDVGYDFIVTEDYTVFKVKDYSVLLPEYLFIFFNRPEFDRYSRWDSWGSATEFFNWPEMSDVDIIVPPLEIQKKYVTVYKSLLANQQAYENGLEDLKLVCDTTIEKFRREMASEEIGKYLQRRNERNLDMKNSNVLGLSTQKQFRKPNSRVNKKELAKYKIVEENWFAFVPTTDTWKVFAFGLNKRKDQIVVSPIYEVFSITDSNKVLPEYLAMWFKRKEFDRYVRFHSWGSARENYNFEELKQVKIPIPDINIQKSIVDIYNAYIVRREINEKLKAQIKDICPILINGSIKEAETYAEV